MINNILSLIKILASFLPFILFAFANGKANLKKELRCQQYIMPLVAIIYSGVVVYFLDKISLLCTKLVMWISTLFDKFNLPAVGNFIRVNYPLWGTYITLVLINTFALIIYITLKKIIVAIFKKKTIKKDSIIGNIVEIFYEYDENDGLWYIKEHYGQARTYIKVAYYSICILSGIALVISCHLCMKKLIVAPFYPVFAIIIIGELAFYIDGLKREEKKSELTFKTDSSRRIAMYPLLMIPLKILFGDKVSASGTTVNEGSSKGGAIEDILTNIESNEDHIGQNYAAFVRKKMLDGLKPNVNYVRCGYDLAKGNSLLFNTPFYDKLNPYVFYSMNRVLLTGGKVLVVLGRHGTEEDLYKWCQQGMLGVSNVPNLCNISILSENNKEDEELPDIGIISRSGVHNLDIHKSNLEFLKKVSFVFIVEPSRLITTAQIGLNLLIKCCGKEKDITFCSVDRNCDGLLDALSHILMTDITEVSATEYPQGINSYMYWLDDGDYIQHRILNGVSRCLGMGCELSMVALKNQVKETIWYGGEAYPVIDMHWIAKQYYHDLLDYAQLPTNQEVFDKCFKTSFNMCNEKVNEYSYITVEDDRNNLFETRRNFATISEKQGFVNVISSEYMLREYMSKNTKLFTADAKAIPYITADFARTKRNAVLSLCLLLCVDTVKEDVLNRQMIVMNIDTNDAVSFIWKEIIEIFSVDKEQIENGNEILVLKDKNGTAMHFKKDEIIIFKRMYSIETGKFENVYTIENSDFINLILEDLQNASYIAESESIDNYIGTELKGHIYQKYLPGQFFTLNGKYYEMISTAVGNRIMVRRASEHIDGRLSYRQIRNYTINKIENSQTMGALKSINNIDIHYQYADFCVDTTGYWKLNAYNGFNEGSLVEINGIPRREYRHKQVLKFDFSKLGDAFNDTIRITLTNLLNEVFVTLFADNQPYISAVTPGIYERPLTYSLEFSEDVSTSEKCIYIIEDSQLDIGLLVAIERNINRIFNIIADYLSWNQEQIEESMREPEEYSISEENSEDVPEEVTETPKKESIFTKIGDWFKGIFKKKRDKKKDKKKESEDDNSVDEGETSKKDSVEDVPAEENVTSEEDSTLNEKSEEEGTKEVTETEGSEENNESDESEDVSEEYKEEESSEDTTLEEDGLVEENETVNEAEVNVDEQ